VKQITILCSSDLAAEVQDVLARADIEGFLHLPRAVGVKPGAAAPMGQWPRWDAEMFVVPAPEESVPAIVEPIRKLADGCEVAPCLRVLVSSLDAVY